MEWFSSKATPYKKKGVLMGKKRIRFIGKFYSGYDPIEKKDVLISKKKIVTVSEEKATQLLTDFPLEFKKLSWKPEPEPEKKEEKKIEEVEEKKLEPLKDKKLEELKNK